MTRRAHPQPLRMIFAVPAFLGAAALAGLVVGLVGDGGWDVAAWLLLGLLPASLLFAWRMRRA